MVEHSAISRGVVGASPTWGAKSPSTYRQTPKRRIATVGTSSPNRVETELVVSSWQHFQARPLTCDRNPVLCRFCGLPGGTADLHADAQLEPTAHPIPETNSPQPLVVLTTLAGSEQKLISPAFHSPRRGHGFAARCPVDYRFPVLDLRSA